MSENIRNSSESFTKVTSCRKISACVRKQSLGSVLKDIFVNNICFLSNLLKYEIKWGGGGYISFRVCIFHNKNALPLNFNRYLAANLNFTKKLDLNQSMVKI